MSFRFSKCLTGPGQDHVCFVLRVNNLHWDRQPTRIFLPYVNTMVPFAACLIYHVINKVTARQWWWEPSIGIIGPKIPLRIWYNCLTIKICARIISLIKPHQKLQKVKYCLVYNWKSTSGEWEDIWISPWPINLICIDTNVRENKQASFLLSVINLFFFSFWLYCLHFLQAITLLNILREKMALCLLDNMQINLSCFITDRNKLKKKLFYFNNLQ